MFVSYAYCYTANLSTEFMYAEDSTFVYCVLDLRRGLRYDGAVYLSPDTLNVFLFLLADLLGCCLWLANSRTTEPATV